MAYIVHIHEGAKMHTRILHHPVWKTTRRQQLISTQHDNLQLQPKVYRSNRHNLGFDFHYALNRTEQELGEKIGLRRNFVFSVFTLVRQQLGFKREHNFRNKRHSAYTHMRTHVGLGVMRTTFICHPCAREPEARGDLLASQGYTRR